MTERTERPYGANRVIIDHDTHVIIRPVHVTAPSFYCSVCDNVLSSNLDVEQHERFGCCDACYRTWAMDDLRRWQEGWRPSLDEVRAVPRRKVNVRIDL